MVIAELFSLGRGRWDGGSPVRQKSIYSTILPENLRYAVRYRDGMLSHVAELESLNALAPQETAYLVAKGINDPEALGGFIRGYVGLIDQGLGRDLSEGLQVLNRECLSNPGLIGFPIQARKLFQVTRRGFDGWHEMFQKGMDRLPGEIERLGVVCYASLTALPQIAGAARERGMTSMTLIDAHAVKGERGGFPVGYEWDLGEGGELTAVKLGKPLKIDALVDDKIITGSTIEAIGDYNLALGVGKVQAYGVVEDDRRLVAVGTGV